MSSHVLHSELLDQIKQLNHHLANDQQVFVDGNQLNLEESNNSKMEIRNTIESLTVALQEQSKDKKDPVVWSSIMDELMATASYIHVNQAVIQANQVHYLNLFQALMSVVSKETADAYEPVAS